MIKKDNIPELSETIKVQLLGVQLVSASPLNYSVVDGLQLNTPPTINSAKSEVQIVIKENDELVREGWLMVTKLMVVLLCLFYASFTLTKHVDLNQLLKNEQQAWKTGIQVFTQDCN